MHEGQACTLVPKSGWERRLPARQESHHQCLRTVFRMIILTQGVATSDLVNNNVGETQT